MVMAKSYVKAFVHRFVERTVVAKVYDCELSRKLEIPIVLPANWADIQNTK